MRPIKQSLVNYFSRALFLVRVEGESCWPRLVPGKSYWASALLKPGEGDFVVFQHPEHREKLLVKRVEAEHKSGFQVGGTVSWASSSSDFGLVNKTLMLGKVLL